MTALAESNKLDPVIGRKRNTEGISNIKQKKENNHSFDW